MRNSLHAALMAKIAVYETRRTGGSTVCNATAHPITRRSGFMVSLANIGVELSAELTDQDLQARIYAFILEQSDALRNHYLGTWVDAGTVYVDVSEHFDSFDAAYDAAIDRDQLALWDIAQACAIPTAPIAW